MKLSDVRWSWILAVALGWILGLLFAARVGVTGARLGPPDAFDLGGVEAPIHPHPAARAR
jgi:hypothetical protein